MDHNNSIGPLIDSKPSVVQSYSPSEGGMCGGYGASVVPSFVGRMRAQLTKAGLAVLAIAISFLLFQNLNLRFYHIFVWNERSDHPPLQHVRNVARSFLEVFQVFPPVLTVSSDGNLEITDGSSNASIKFVENDHATCQQALAVHSFANSYNEPFIRQYAPPPCAFNRVSWNLTVVSAGKQFDRLGIVYLGDIEVFRLSTAEPTTDGTRWVYLKDMTSYLSMFRSDQKLIFDLGNLITNVYTAAFNVTLTASYFTAKDSITPADVILPVSKRLASRNQPSAFMVPPELASNDLKLGKNVRRAVVTIAATGQDEEEFWWSNVLQSDVDTFPQYGKLYGYSPFREIQLMIDGMLAGVAWPFPTIFTGGIVPGLWRPIVGIDAFDLKEYEIDITPWLPLLCDDNPHTFSIVVSGLEDDGHGTAFLSNRTRKYWWITGKVFIWYDASNHTTTGDGPYITTLSDFHVSSSIEKGANGTNETLRYNVRATRRLQLYSTINLSQGEELATWDQHLSYSNDGVVRDGANVEENEQYTDGYVRKDASSSGYASLYRYPLYVYSVEGSIKDNFTIMATVRHGKEVKTTESLVFPTGLESFSTCGALCDDFGAEFQAIGLRTMQNGTATYLGNQTNSTSFSFGTTQQTMTLQGLKIDHSPPTLEFPTVLATNELFERVVKAVNGNVMDDRATLINQPISHFHFPSYKEDGGDFALSHALERRAHMGRNMETDG